MVTGAAGGVERVRVVHAPTAVVAAVGGANEGTCGGETSLGGGGCAGAGGGGGVGIVRLRGDGAVMAAGEVWEGVEGAGGGESGGMVIMENEMRRGDFGGGAGDGAVRLARGVLEGEGGERREGTRIVVASLRGSERSVVVAGAAGTMPGAGGVVVGGALTAGAAAARPAATVVVRRMRTAAAAARRSLRRRCRASCRCRVALRSKLR